MLCGKMACFLMKTKGEMSERTPSRCPKCSQAPRKSLWLAHSVPQITQSNERHSGKLWKSIALTSQLGCGASIAGEVEAWIIK
jgi:hypothetical protein